MSTETPWTKVNSWMSYRVMPIENKTSKTAISHRKPITALASLEQQAQSEWNASPALQAEFKRFGTYLAYRLATKNKK